MSAYCLFQNLEITDPAKMSEYVERVRPVTESFGGRYVVMGGPMEVKEGDWSPAWPVMIEFPTLEAANRWYASIVYQPLKALRHAAGSFSAVFMQGTT